MIDNRRRAVALSFGFAILAFAAPAIAAKFDGAWTMTAVTTKGHCGIIPVSFSVTRGRIHPGGGSYAFYPIKLSGQVSPSGSTSLKAITGPRVAVGAGRLKGGQGSGTWKGKGPSGLCFGTWTAVRG